MDKKNLLSLFDSLPESEKEKIYERNRALMILESVNLKSTLVRSPLSLKMANMLFACRYPISL